ncbi:MAG: tRNA dihydrouridine synthase DusB [Nitrospirae bacterium RBG_19FT_COMBO_42_15]|nr:MAG: tRNA dihydrouridine synthase DusB [Nitrospirae bacterium RBG_19FT_COMBO_42_15]
MQIGNLKIENKLILAPMAGITNLPFRLIVKDEGCGLVVSEMVSAIALVRNGKKTRDLLNSDPYERPLAVQLFGSEPQIMAEAARIVEGFGVDILDINMGCPAKKVVSSGSGSALLRDPLRIKAIIEAVRAAVTIPFTVKIRSGWDSKSTNYLEIGRIAEECGVDAITLHSRTAAQGFGGRSDWSHIAELKKVLNIPVIGNGDIKTPEDAMRMLDETCCDGIMIGRGALGNPWIFSRTLKYIEEGVLQKPPSEKEIHLTIKRHIEMLADYMGDKWAVREFRKHISWYTKGLFHSADFRKSVIHIDSMEALMDETEAYFETLESIDDDFSFQAFVKKSRNGNYFFQATSSL